MPGINDDPKQVEELLELIGEAGARSIGGIGLHLRGEVRDIWFDWLRQYRPDLVPRYEELYARGAYLRRDEGERLAALARGKTAPRRTSRGRRGRDIGNGDSAGRPSATAKRKASAVSRRQAREPAEQRSLF
jgi:DNA repair photolyase